MELYNAIKDDDMKYVAEYIDGDGDLRHLESTISYIDETDMDISEEMTLYFINLGDDSITNRFLHGAIYNHDIDMLNLTLSKINNINVSEVLGVSTIDYITSYDKYSNNIASSKKFSNMKISKSIFLTIVNHCKSQITLDTLNIFYTITHYSSIDNYIKDDAITYILSKIINNNKNILKDVNKNTLIRLLGSVFNCNGPQYIIDIIKKYLDSDDGINFTINTNIYPHYIKLLSEDV